MGDSDDRIPVERDSVETMLTALKTMRGAFNPDLAALQANAPGIGAFAERLDLGIERIEALLDSGGDPLSVKRENVETMLERVRNFRSNFNPDSAALKENTPGIAAFAERLESAADRLEDALK
jgi:methyl-accepting chemotaxis protein